MLYCVSMQCDANPEVSKVAIMEDKYENVLTLIIYYQMVRGDTIAVCHSYDRRRHHS